MSILDIFLTYFGTVSLVLIFLYGTKDYRVTLLWGFITFCVFYFAYVVKDFKWEIGSMFLQLKDAAIIYIISFVISLIIYKLLPPKTIKATGTEH
jgi:hypothetical protein